MGGQGHRTSVKSGTAGIGEDRLAQASQTRTVLRKAAWEHFMPQLNHIVKSFQPISDATGYGFNNMKKFGMIVRRWPMRTSIGPSRYDSNDVYSLNYRYYYSAAGIVSMQDEIRKVQEGFYLGVGHWRLPIGISMASVWFALTGAH